MLRPLLPALLPWSTSKASFNPPYCCLCIVLVFYFIKGAGGNHSDTSKKSEKITSTMTPCFIKNYEVGEYLFYLEIAFNDIITQPYCNFCPTQGEAKGFPGVFLESMSNEPF